jgi:hypothetical protein
MAGSQQQIPVFDQAKKMGWKVRPLCYSAKVGL